jgi:hypothetical protein
MNRVMLDILENLAVLDGLHSLIALNNLLKFLERQSGITYFTAYSPTSLLCGTTISCVAVRSWISLKSSVGSFGNYLRVDINLKLLTHKGTAYQADLGGCLASRTSFEKDSLEADGAGEWDAYNSGGGARY